MADHTEQPKRAAVGFYWPLQEKMLSSTVILFCTCNWDVLFTFLSKVQAGWKQKELFTYVLLSFSTGNQDENMISCLFLLLTFFFSQIVAFCVEAESKKIGKERKEKLGRSKRTKHMLKLHDKVEWDWPCSWRHCRSRGPCDLDGDWCCNNEGD